LYSFFDHQSSTRWIWLRALRVAKYAVSEANIPSKGRTNTPAESANLAPSSRTAGGRKRLSPAKKAVNKKPWNTCNHVIRVFTRPSSCRMCSLATSKLSFGVRRAEGATCGALVELTDSTPCTKLLDMPFRKQSFWLLRLATAVSDPKVRARAQCYTTASFPICVMTAAILLIVFAICSRSLMAA
jgi:hypothetical protein